MLCTLAILSKIVFFVYPLEFKKVVSGSLSMKSDVGRTSAKKFSGGVPSSAKLFVLKADVFSCFLSCRL